MAKRKVPSEHEGSVSVATEVVGGGEDVGVISPRGMVEAATSALKPIAMARESARLYGEWLKILWGSSTREVPVKDWRFADPTWREHPMYKRLAQGYLAFCDAIDKVVDDNPDWRKRERARFLTGILTSTMAPTNTLIGNPAALKKAYETGGKSLVRGAQNMIGDLRHNKGMPSQVKRSDFKVGENLAASPGAVVLRTLRRDPRERFASMEPKIFSLVFKNTSCVATSVPRNLPWRYAVWQPMRALLTSPLDWISTSP